MYDVYEYLPCGGSFLDSRTSAVPSTLFAMILSPTFTPAADAISGSEKNVFGSPRRYVFTPMKQNSQKKDKMKFKKS